MTKDEEIKKLKSVAKEALEEVQKLKIEIIRLDMDPCNCAERSKELKRTKSIYMHDHIDWICPRHGYKRI